MSYQLSVDRDILFLPNFNEDKLYFRILHFLPIKRSYTEERSPKYAAILHSGGKQKGNTHFDVF